MMNTLRSAFGRRPSQGAGAPSPSHPATDDPIAGDLLQYPPGEPRFAAAARKAKATLPRFFELANKGLQGVYLVKVSLTGGGETEHIWVEVTGMRNGAFLGRLANDPVVPGHRAGDPVEVARDDIEDWMINTGDARYGGYSVRAMLDDMPAEMAKELRRQLRD